MIKNNDNWRDIFFVFIYFFIIMFGFFIYDLFIYLEENLTISYGYDYFLLFFANIIAFYLISKGKVYAYIYSFYVLILLLLVYISVIKEDFSHCGSSDVWISVWQIMVIVICYGIFICIKKIIEEHIKYRRLDFERRKNINTLKDISIRISHFFLCFLNIYIVFKYFST